MCLILRQFWLISLALYIVNASVISHRHGQGNQFAANRHAHSASNSSHSPPYWPTFSEGLSLDGHLADEVVEPVKKTVNVEPGVTHHHHDFEYWHHYIDNHEERDNFTHDDKYFANNNFGYETADHCIYDLRIHYIWGSPDGVWKRMIAYNGQFPGPTLYCTSGKTMVVRVTNEIEDDEEPTSVHWHGIQQTLTPFYDGPQAISQCPVLPTASMIYKFPVFQSGTYWYHSHHTYQYADGNWGYLALWSLTTNFFSRNKFKICQQTEIPLLLHSKTSFKKIKISTAE